MRLIPSQTQRRASKGKSEDDNTPVEHHPALSLLGQKHKTGKEYTATSVRWTALMWVLITLAIPIIYITLLQGTLNKQNEEAAQHQATVFARKSTPTRYLSVGMVVTELYSEMTQEAFTTTPTPSTPVPATLAPTVTPTPPIPMTSTPEYYNAADVVPVYWWINYQPPPPGSYSGPVPAKKIEVYAKLSYYYPPLAYVNPKASINCDKLDNGWLECEHMTDGEKVRYNVGIAAACPKEFPRGSVLKIGMQKWICKDTGGAIVSVSDNVYWVDLLYPYMPIENHFWGDIIPIEVYLNEGGLN